MLKNPNVVFTPLNTHQGMAVEVTDEVVSSFLSEGTTKVQPFRQTYIATLLTTSL